MIPVKISQKIYTRKNLLLPELIIVILFFSLAAAGCVKLFASAYEDSNFSRDLTTAVIEAQNAAECFKTAGGDLEETARLFGGSVVYATSDNVTYAAHFFYDEDWNKAVQVTDPDYCLEILIKEDNNVIYGEIKVYKDIEVSEILSDRANDYIYMLNVAVNP